MSARPIGVAIVGLGFMGKTHAAAYRAAADVGVACEIVATCERTPAPASAAPSRAGNLGASGAVAFDPSRTRAYRDVAECLADPRVDLVSVCTPTDTHVEIARAALRAGKHVLVEKPVSLDAREIEALAEDARRAERLCMPALCMRFWPGWTWLRERVADGSLGAVRSAIFQRLSSPPDWSTDFYRDARRSGGALADLHLHDADFVRWCFGEPDDVSSAGSLDHVFTTYRYRRGPALVAAEGGWDQAAGFGFRMRYVVGFERATADFDLARTPPLLLHRDGKSEPVAIPPGTGYDGEVRHLLDAIAQGRADLAATLADAASTARLLDRERKQLER